MACLIGCGLGQAQGVVCQSRSVSALCLCKFVAIGSTALGVGWEQFQQAVRFKSDLQATYCCVAVSVKVLAYLLLCLGDHVCPWLWKAMCILKAE